MFLKQKKYIILIVLTLILLLPQANAEFTCTIQNTTNCAQQNTLIKLLNVYGTGYDNAHAEMPNYANPGYQYSICCESTTQNINLSCEANNAKEVLRLADQTNTHVQFADNYQGLIAHWKLNNNLYDSIGTNHATNNGATWTTDRRNNPNHALNFDNNFANTDFKITTQQFTVSLWVSFNQLVNSYIANQWQSGHSGRLIFSETGTQFGLHFGGTRYGDFTPELNNWYHVVVTRDENNLLTFYVNGTSVASATRTQAVPDSVFQFGGTNKTSSRNSNSKISDVRVYDRALSAQEISNLYEDGLIGHWKLEGDFQDYSGQGNDATNNAATWTHNRYGVSNRAINLEGSSYLAISNTPITVDAISLWFKTNSATEQIILGGFLNSHDSATITLRDNQIHVSRGGGIKTTRNNFNDNTWHHLVVLAGDPFRIYVDGKEEPTTTSSVSNRLSQRRAIGARYYQSIYELFFQGRIDDVRVFNREITEQEIQALFLEGKSKYSNSVCLAGEGTVECVASPTLCPQDYTCIGSIASSEGWDYTNAHIASCDYYDLQVCCFLNDLPQMNTARIEPITPSVDDDLIGYCEGTDTNSAQLMYYYTWYLNGAHHSNGTTSYHDEGEEINVANISNTITSQGQQWILECTAFDGNDFSEALNSTAVEIENCNPPTTGRWNVDGKEVCRDKTITVLEFIYIESGDELIFENVTLNMNYPTSNTDIVRVYDGGEFKANNSIITSTVAGRYPRVRIYSGGYGYFNNVTLTTGNPYVDFRNYGDAEIYNSSFNYVSRYYDASKTKIENSYIANPFVYVRTGHELEINNLDYTNTALNYEIASNNGLEVNITNTNMYRIRFFNTHGKFTINNSNVYGIVHYNYNANQGTTIQNTQMYLFTFYAYQSNVDAYISNWENPATSYTNNIIDSNNNEVNIINSDITRTYLYASNSGRLNVNDSIFHRGYITGSSVNKFINITPVQLLNLYGSSNNKIINSTMNPSLNIYAYQTSYTEIENSVLDSVNHRLYDTAVYNFTKPNSEIKRLRLPSGNPAIAGYVNISSVSAWTAGAVLRRTIPFNVTYTDGFPAENAEVTIKDDQTTIDTGYTNEEGIVNLEINQDNSANQAKQYQILVNEQEMKQITILENTNPHGVELLGIPSITMLIKPEEEEIIYERKPLFNWTHNPGANNITYHLQLSLSNDFQTLIINNTGIPTLSFNSSTVLDEALNFETYHWRIRAYNEDEELYGEWSNKSNFTVQSLLAINIINPGINFGTLEIGEEKNTTTNNPEPFKFKNQGNIEADLKNMTATNSIWQTPTAGLNTDYWQIKLRENPEAYNTQSSKTNWMNITNVIEDVVIKLNYTGTQQDHNEIEMDIKIKVPQQEPPGDKTEQITFTWIIHTP